MNTLPVPPGISPPGGIFYSTPHFTFLFYFLFACILHAPKPLFSQDNPEKRQNSLKIDLSASYQDTNQAASEAGGLRDEKRDRNRLRHVHKFNVFADATINSSQYLGFKGAWLGYHDYQYYNQDEDIHSDTQRLSEAYFYYQSDESCRHCPPVFVPNGPDANSSALAIRAGRQLWSYDQKGLFFTGESPSLILTSKSSILDNSHLSFQSAISSMEREHRALRGLRESRQTPAMLYLFNTTWEQDRWHVSALYGFLRVPGRDSQPDLQSTIPIGYGLSKSFVYAQGQSGIMDRDVHYYGINGSWKNNDWGFLYDLYHNYGRSIAVDHDGTRIGSSRKSIQGSLIYTSLYYQNGSDVALDSCPLFLWSRGACFANKNQQKKHKTAIQLLYSTRDSNSSDQNLEGYAAPRPLIGTMGSGGSILLAGVPGTLDNPALANRQPARDLSLNNQAPIESFESYTDNTDPALPDYNNDGIRMGGLQYAYAIANSGLSSLQIYGNYAALRYGDGYEFIMALDGKYGLQASSLKKTNDFRGLNWMILATACWYTPHERMADPYTKISYKAKTRFYSRFQAHVNLAF